MAWIKGPYEDKVCVCVSLSGSISGILGLTCWLYNVTSLDLQNHTLCT